MYLGKHFSLYNRIKRHWEMSKCSDKLGILHQIDSKKGLDHFLNYSAQNVIGFMMLTSRLTDKSIKRLYHMT